jgi:hypothetical protein
MHKLYAHEMHVHEMHAHENAHRITICVRSAPHANSPSPELALESAPPIHFAAAAERQVDLQ